MLTTMHKRLGDEYPSMTAKVVGRVKVEFTASWSQTKRSTRLSYVPVVVPCEQLFIESEFNRCCV